MILGVYVSGSKKLPIIYIYIYIHIIIYNNNYYYYYQYKYIHIAETGVSQGIPWETNS